MRPATLFPAKPALVTSLTLSPVSERAAIVNEPSALDTALRVKTVGGVDDRNACSRENSVVLVDDCYSRVAVFGNRRNGETAIKNIDTNKPYPTAFDNATVFIFTFSLKRTGECVERD